MTNNLPQWALEGQAAYTQKTFRKKGKLRTLFENHPAALKVFKYQ
ncbi:hypothetical protein [Marinifilum flexuosum]|nr:hypothetical protein [Marinifilum flexuosum]